MDSVVLAHMLRDEGDELVIVSFNYGQRHFKELEFAKKCASDLACPWKLIDLTGLNKYLGGSALTDRNVDVPHGHYAALSMKATVVPNRNAIMLSIATGIAVVDQASYVATAVHAGDHAIYPDCRPTFIDLMNQTMQIATEGFHAPHFQISAPFAHMTKAHIVSVGDLHAVDFSQTWSCYEGKMVHCGECGTCVERKEAFGLAGIKDPTEYASI
jgi:7-cyano-7-deazaguanine synthase